MSGLLIERKSLKIIFIAQIVKRGKNKKLSIWRKFDKGSLVNWWEEKEISRGKWSFYGRKFDTGENFN